MKSVLDSLDLPMPDPSAPFAAFMNLLGFMAGTSLYSMLLVMVLRSASPAFAGTGRIPLLAALSGLSWNLVALSSLTLPKITALPVFGAVSGLAASALGLLPALFIDVLSRRSTAVDGAGYAFNDRRLAMVGYAITSTAALFFVFAALSESAAARERGFMVLSLGFLLLGAVILVRHSSERDVTRVGVVSLLLFALSAAHLATHQPGHDTLYSALIGHHASLPLAIAILYADYRFALIDVFLKRALAFSCVGGVVFAAVAFILFPLRAQADSSPPGPLALAIIVLSGTALASFYPTIRLLCDRIVDRSLLRRPDHHSLRADLSKRVAEATSVEELLAESAAFLTSALETQVDSRMIPQGILSPQGLTGSSSLVADGSFETLGDRRQWAATVSIPATDAPRFAFVVAMPRQGRRLFSDDIALLDFAGWHIARKIDAIRLVHERCARDLREEEVSRLVAEAELKTLRAQLNPHFLFNALNTIGSLMKAAPEKALDTLLELTTLLRGVLRRSDGEFLSLGQEMDLIQAYLAIEAARFEERLRIQIDVPTELMSATIPALSLQPLVENAIKHGISSSPSGGELVVRAAREVGAHGEQRITVTVLDSGLGVSEAQLALGRRNGVGLNNVERRLKLYFGNDGGLTIKSTPGYGTMVQVRMPLVVRTESARTSMVGAGAAL